MQAYISSMNCAGVKIVSGYENARKLGYPYISGLYMLTDVETGIPLAIMDCVWMTTVRTGAVTGLTAKVLANRRVNRYRRSRQNSGSWLNGSYEKHQDN